MSDAGQPTPDVAPTSTGPRRLGLIARVGLIGVLLVLAAGIGLAVGRLTAPGPDIIVTTAPVIEQAPTLDSLPAGNDRPQGVEAGPSGAQQLLVGGTAATEVPAVFTPANDLPDSADTASGYRLTRAGITPSDVATALASVFGVAGETVAREGGFLVGSADGTGASLSVNEDPLVTWRFDDPQAASRVGGKAVTSDRAVLLASALLSGIGVDVDAVDWQVDRYEDRTAVTAWQLVDGSRTHLSWQVDLGRGDTVTSAAGFSAGIQEVPGYSVVGAATAVRRAALPTWAAIGPAPLLDAAAPEAPGASVSSSAPGPTPTPIPSPRSVAGRPSLRVPMAGIVVTDAELGLAQFWQPDGDLLVLPAYLLTGDDGSRWSLIAVTSDYVDFVDQPYPSVDSQAD